MRIKNKKKEMKTNKITKLRKLYTKSNIITTLLLFFIIISLVMIITFNSTSFSNTEKRKSVEKKQEISIIKDSSDIIKQYQRQTVRLSAITGIFNFTGYLYSNNFLVTAYTDFLNNINYTQIKQNLSNFSKNECNKLLNKLKDKYIDHFEIINPGEALDAYIMIDNDLIDKGKYDENFNITMNIKNVSLKDLNTKQIINYSGSIKNNVYLNRLLFIIRKLKDYLKTNRIGEISCAYLPINTCGCCKLSENRITKIMDKVSDDLNNIVFKDQGIKCSYNIKCKYLKTQCIELSPIILSKCGPDGKEECIHTACFLSTKKCSFNQDNFCLPDKHPLNNFNTNIMNYLKQKKIKYKANLGDYNCDFYQEASECNSFRIIHKMSFLSLITCTDENNQNVRINKGFDKLKVNLYINYALQRQDEHRNKLIVYHECPPPTPITPNPTNTGTTTHNTESSPPITHTPPPPPPPPPPGDG